ncbi:MAG: siderophore-interacting protein [Kocuria sp.]|nr:siderophore-interacting protein [Kocuria sp.]
MATDTSVATNRPVVCARATVTSVEQLSPHFRRICVAGRELAGFSARLVGQGGATTCSDAYIKLLIPPHGAAPTRPDMSGGYRAWFAQPQEERGFLRTYTARSIQWVPWNGETVPELTVDFVLHPETQGPGGRWAEEASPGDTAFIVGPGPGEPAWTSWGPGRARRIVAVGDETAVPALLSIMEELDGHNTADRVDVIMEVPTRADVLTSNSCDGMIVHALPRSESGANGAGSVRTLAHILDLPMFCVADVLAGRRPERAVEPPAEHLWEVADPGADRDTYVFLAGEAANVKAWRRLCVDGAGIPKENVSFMGYWRRGHAES